MYPNPARSNVTIAATNMQGAVDVTIYNQTGVLVYSEVLGGSGAVSRLNVNTSQLPSGLYFVSVRGANTDSTEKLIIE